MRATSGRLREGRDPTLSVSGCPTAAGSRPAVQRDALETAGVDAVNVYHDLASGVRDEPARLVVWKLDRLGRNLAHLVNTVQDLSARAVGLRVLAGQGAQVDTPDRLGGHPPDAGEDAQGPAGCASSTPSSPG